MDSNLETYNSEMADASTRGDIATVREMLAEGADDVVLALVNAAEEGHLDIMRLMMDHGGEDGLDVAMPEAARRGQLDAMRLLHDLDTNLLEEPSIRYEDAMEVAIEAGQVEAVRLLASMYDGYDYDAALVKATEGGHLTIIKLLVDRGADGLEIAMPEAARHGRLEAMKLLHDIDTVLHDVPVIRYDDAMEVAVASDQVEAVRLLASMHYGYDYNAALVKAAEGGNFDMVRLLVNLGATDYDKAMAVAAYMGYAIIMRLMIDHGARTYDKAMAEAARGGHLDIVQGLLDLGATDVNAALVKAAEGGYPEVMRLMLSLGANDYDTALAEAAGAGHIEIVRGLLHLGAATMYDWALTLAAWGGHNDVVRLMAAWGAGDYDRAIDAARTQGHPDTVNVLVNLGMLYAVETDNMDLARRMADLIPSNMGEVLQIAANKGYADMVALALEPEPGAMIPTEITDEVLNTALATAASNGNIDVVRLLVDLAPDYNTAITRAVANNHMDVLRYLVNKAITTTFARPGQR